MRKRKKDREMKTESDYIIIIFVIGMSDNNNKQKRRKASSKSSSTHTYIHKIIRLNELTKPVLVLCFRLLLLLSMLFFSWYLWKGESSNIRLTQFKQTSNQHSLIVDTSNNENMNEGEERKEVDYDALIFCFFLFIVFG